MHLICSGIVPTFPSASIYPCSLKSLVATTSEPLQKIEPSWTASGKLGESVSCPLSCAAPASESLTSDLRAASTLVATGNRCDARWTDPGNSGCYASRILSLTCQTLRDAGETGEESREGATTLACAPFAAIYFADLSLNHCRH